MPSTIQLTASDGHVLDAYSVQPVGAPRGAIVVIQEIFGVTGHIRWVAEGYAAAGYHVVVPALFDRVRRDVELAYSDIASGKAFVEQIAPADAMRDVAAAVDHAAQFGKVAVVGFCWGGTLAFLAGGTLPVSAVVAYYGGGIAANLATLPKVPVMYHFGADDPYITADHVGAIRNAVDSVNLHTYEGAGHGFNCDERPDYRAESAASARERSLAFLADNLG